MFNFKPKKAIQLSVLSFVTILSVWLGYWQYKAKQPLTQLKETISVVALTSNLLGIQRSSGAKRISDEKY